MANSIPCPNPTCTHDFSMAELQAATQIVCPKCGFRMQGKAAAPPKPTAPAAKPAPPPATKPVAQANVKPATPPMATKPAAATPVQATPKVALATPVQSQPKSATPLAAGPNPPVATPISAPPATAAPAAKPVNSEESLPDGSFFNPNVGGGTGTLVRTGTAKKKFNWLRLLIVLFSIGFAASVVIIAIVMIFWFFLGTEGLRDVMKQEGDSVIGKIRNSKNENEKVYKLMLPRKEWLVDGEISTRFGAHAAWKSVDYDFWFAIYVKDHGMTKPRDAEMLRIAIDKLEGHFGEDMELAAKAEPFKFGPQALPAQKLHFRGVVNDAKWDGECHMFFNNGIAYWLFMASPDSKVVAHFADELPEKLVFVVSDRRGWREQPPPVENFSSEGQKIDMSAPKGVWEKSVDPKSEDPNGVLLLAGRYLREKDNKKNALLVIFTMPKQDDLKAALKTARDHLEAREKESNEKAKVVHAADVKAGQTEVGTLEDVGNRRGRMIDLKLQIGDEPEPHRYYLLSVVNDPDTCYVILCECSWKSQQIWRQDFLDVIRTLRVK
jgi:hypothetical protein